MVVEGASHAIKGAATFVAKKGPEAAGKAAGVVANNAEKAVGVAKGVVESTSGTVRGASESFKEAFAQAREPQRAQQLVDKLATGSQSVVAPSESPAAQPVTTEGTIPSTRRREVVRLPQTIQTNRQKRPLGKKGMSEKTRRKNVLTLTLKMN